MENAGLMEPLLRQEDTLEEFKVHSSLNRQHKVESQRAEEFGQDFCHEIGSELILDTSENSEASDSSSINIQCPHCEETNRLDAKIFKGSGDAKPIKCYKCDELFECSMDGWEHPSNVGGARIDEVEPAFNSNFNREFSSFRSGSDIGHSDRFIPSSSSLRKPPVDLLPPVENEEESNLISESIGYQTQISDLHSVAENDKQLRGSWFGEKWNAIVFPCVALVAFLSFCIIVWFLFSSIGNIQNQVETQNLLLLGMQSDHERSMVQVKSVLREVNIQNQHLKTQIKNLTDAAGSLNVHLTKTMSGLETTMSGLETMKSGVHNLGFSLSETQSNVDVHSNKIKNLSLTSTHQTNEISKCATITISLLRKIGNVQSSFDIQEEELNQQESMLKGLIQDFQGLKNSNSGQGTNAFSSPGQPLDGLG